MKNSRHSKINNKRGFTIIETLVALLIIMSALVVSFSVVNNSFNAAEHTQDQVTATYLAQDAMEYIRFVRDSNVIGLNPWLTNIETPCAPPNGCLADTNVVNPLYAIEACPNGCRPLNMAVDAQNNPIGYGYHPNDCTAKPGCLTTPRHFSGSFSASKFTRTITATPVAISGGNETTVVVTVSWLAQNGVARTFSVREDLFKWQIQ